MTKELYIRSKFMKNMYGKDFRNQKGSKLVSNTKYCFCDFRQVVVGNEMLENVVFYGCRVNGLDLTNARLKNISFEFCYASVRSKELKLPPGSQEEIRVFHSHLNTSLSNVKWLTWHPDVVELADMSLEENVDIDALLNPFPEARLIESKSYFLCVFPLLAVLLIHPDEKVKYYAFDTLWEGLRIGFEHVNYQYIAEWMASFFDKNYCFVDNRAGHFLDFFSYFYEQDNPIVKENQVLAMMNQIYSNDLAKVEKGVMVNATVVLAEITRFLPNVDYEYLTRLWDKLPLHNQVVVLDIVEKGWEDGAYHVGTSTASGEGLLLLFNQALHRSLVAANPRIRLRGLGFFDKIIDLYDWKDFDVLEQLTKDLDKGVRRKAREVIEKIK